MASAFLSGWIAYAAGGLLILLCIVAVRFLFDDPNN
jgi:hypothetical protein